MHGREKKNVCAQVASRRIVWESACFYQGARLINLIKRHMKAHLNGSSSLHGYELCAQMSVRFLSFERQLPPLSNLEHKCNV
jgi:hypothetical protein